MSSRGSSLTVRYVATPMGGMEGCRAYSTMVRFFSLDFSNQRLEFFAVVILLVKLPHIPEILNRKTFDAGKLLLKII